MHDSKEEKRVLFDCQGGLNSDALCIGGWMSIFAARILVVQQAVSAFVRM